MNSQYSTENTNNLSLSDSGCDVRMTNELTNLNLSHNYNGEEIVSGKWSILKYSKYR